MSLSRIARLQLLSIILMLAGTAASAEPSPPGWPLPLVLSDANTVVEFEVDSTWHLVHGKTGGVAGRVWLANPKDPLSVMSDIHIPVALFRTNMEMRDSKLREVMAAEKFPEVAVRTSAVEGGCLPQAVAGGGKCRGVFVGTVRIRDVEKPMRLPYQVSAEKGGYLISGELPIAWADFGVEDPSILIAKLDPTVTIKYRLAVPGGAVPVKE